MIFNLIIGFIIIGAVVVTSTILLLKKRNRAKWRNVDKDTVVLHMIPRGHYVPNLSPFVIKLETYLKMAGIPYQVDTDEPRGPKGKFPWITLNGEDMADSQLIMEMLANKYDKDFSIHLTPVEKAIALAMRVALEEQLLWCLAIWRFGTDSAKAFRKDMEVPKLMKLVIPFIKRQVMSNAKAQGIGRHSIQDIEKIGRSILEAVSVYLGDKPYFMGDQPTEVDCTIFGFLAQFVWGTLDTCPYASMVESEFPNLKPYCFRMKTKFWPDWNQCLQPPKMKEEEGENNQNIAQEIGN